MRKRPSQGDTRRLVARYELIVGLIALAAGAYAQGFDRHGAALFLVVFGVVAVVVALGVGRRGRAAARVGEDRSS